MGTFNRKAAQQAKEANQSSNSKGSVFPIAMKAKKGHKRSWSDSRGHSQDRRKRHSGHSGSEETVPSSEETITPEQPKLPASATLNPSGPKASGAGNTYTKRTVGTDAVPLGNRRPRDGTVPKYALSVETLDGQLVYKGTEDKPIIKFETCRGELKQMARSMRLWTVDLLEVEITGLKDKSRPGGPWSLWQNTLPRLPEWVSPNRWDYWGRPWAYMDAPNRHSAIKIKSVHSKQVADITIEVLVNCEREPQYLPNLDVAKSAAAAPTWHDHQAQVVDGSGNLHPKISVPKAAGMVQPPNFDGPNSAVEALFNMWDSFRTSKNMWRPNPEMPHGDATPEGCLQTLTVAQLSEHRPVESVPPTRPVDPTRPHAAPHVDPEEFPEMPSSSNEGIGGIPGSRDFPQGTTWASVSKTAVTSTVTTTVSTPNTAVTTAVTTTSTTTTPVPGSSLHAGRRTLDLKVTVALMSPEQVKAVRGKLAAMAKPNPPGQGKAHAQGSILVEPMETETSRQTRQKSYDSERTPIPDPSLPLGTRAGGVLKARALLLRALPSPRSRRRRGLAKWALPA